MFEQTFVSEEPGTKKTYTVFLSLALQTAGIFVLILLPLIYTPILPSAQLKGELVAAPRPPIAPAATAVRRVTMPSHRVLDAHLLFAPRVIPTQINRIQESLEAPAFAVASGASGQEQGQIGLPDGNIGSDLKSAPLPPLPKPEQKKGPVRVGTLSESNLIYKVTPIYPPVARAARVQGVVEFRAVISKEGTIENLQLVRGSPLLVNAAKSAVLQWRYRPTLLNGQPVEVETDIIVDFTLSR